MQRATLAAAAFLIVATASMRASADCNNFPYDPLCGSFVNAISSGTGGATQELDANPTDPNQSLGPAYTERLADPNDLAGEGNIVHDTSSGLIEVDQGVFAVEMGADSDAHDYGANVDAAAAGRVTYDEDLSVQSASVAAGTPVMVYLRYRVAWGTRLFHSLDPSLLNDTSETSRVQIQIQSYLDNHLGGSDTDDSAWFTTLGVFQNITGLFAAPSPGVQLAVPVQVGQTVKLHLYLSAGIGATSNVYFVTPPDQFPNAATAATVAVVFGVETDTPGVNVVSSLLGGPLPDFTNVTQSNAIASALPVTIGGPVTVPEPGALSCFGVAAAALAALRSRT